MERIWAPWRKAYIQQGTPEGCIFCEKPREGDDRKSHIISRASTCFSMLNIYPYNTGHLMVAPFRHVADLQGLSREELADLMDMLRDSVSLLKKALSPDGFNVGINLGGAAGAGVVDHVHVHVVPRWEGDTNFMPITADTKVIPQALDDVYDVLTSRKAQTKM